MKKGRIKKFFVKVGSFIKRIFLKYWHAVVDAFLHDQKKIAKYIICLSAILHLILSSYQIQAINKLSNELCGIAMFLFILFGFVCLFNAIRLKEPKGKNLIFSILMLVLTIGTGGYLLSIYFDSLAHQKNLVEDAAMAAAVKQGVTLSIVVLALYLIGLVETIVACIYYHKTLKKKNKEIENA